jgi:hypothetical protein
MKRRVMKKTNLRMKAIENDWKRDNKEKIERVWDQRVYG